MISLTKGESFSPKGNQMFFKMGLKERPVVFLIAREKMIEPLSKKVLTLRSLGIQQETISDIEELPGFLLIQKRREILVRQVFEFRYLRKIGCHMIECGSLFKFGESKLMYLPVERGVYQGKQTHCLEPTCPGCFQMESPL